MGERCDHDVLQQELDKGTLLPLALLRAYTAARVAEDADAAIVAIEQEQEGAR